jgi:hypothetical protein
MEGEPVSKLRGMRNQQAALATTVFSQAELLLAYNEMMALFKLHMPDLLNNNRQLEQICTRFFYSACHAAQTGPRIVPEIL